MVRTLNKKSNGIISRASPHTIKKFELVEKYIKDWAQKLMMSKYCEGLIFIDCMCNCGVYYDDMGELVDGTPVRVAEILRNVAGQYPQKKVFIHFNDHDQRKIKELQNHLPQDKNNFHIRLTTRDANELLEEIGSSLNQNPHLHFFLFYDPYDASINWDALAPFFKHWGEVLINHMISDPVRGAAQAKKAEAKNKYMNTYLMDVEELIPYGSNKEAYEKRLESIVNTIRGKASRDYYLSSFPFFNTTNAFMYDLVHCTSNVAGFKLFKSTAWKTFGGKSSTKNTINSKQLEFLTSENMDADFDVETDKNCYFVSDIAKYVQQQFNGRQNVPYNEIWDLLDKHPVFPGESYRNEIKEILVREYGAVKQRSSISFSQRIY